MVVMTVAGALLAITAGSLFRSQGRLNLGAGTSRLISESREQQMRAMAGDTAPLDSYIDYSVRFEEDRYIVFPGSVYDAGNPINTVVTLEAPLIFTNVTLPSSIITFSRLSGEVSGLVPGQDSLVFANSQTGDERLIIVNKYGVLSVQ